MTLTIESLAFGGMGVAHIGEMVVFVKNAIPGQTVTVRILKKRRTYLEGKCLEVEVESPHAVPLKCTHHEYCGGCSHQNLSYEKQLEYKSRQVEDIFRRLGGFSDITVLPILGCEEIFHYRNKMEFTFSNRRFITDADEHLPRDYVLGAHTPGRYDKILNIDECFLQAPVCNEILAFVKERVHQMGLPPYDILEHTGFMRYLVLRAGTNTGQVMVNLVTAGEDRENLGQLAEDIRSHFPTVTGVVNNVTTRKAGVSAGEREILLFGQEYIVETIGKWKFEISANSFFQTNTRQAERLYDLILEESELTGKEVVYDLFCGTGSIGIFLSSLAAEVIGFELVRSAIQDAERNAKLNSVENIRFFEGDLMNIFRSIPMNDIIPSPDVMIIDPPRAGMHSRTVGDVLKQAPRRIVYVSCNPSTQARDVRMFCDGGYELLKIRPVDMFPHTPHLENIAVLTRKV